MTTYRAQADRFDWKRWDLYRELQDQVVSVPRIAARFGRTPCEVRRFLEEGARLEAWRPAR